MYSINYAYGIYGIRPGQIDTRFAQTFALCVRIGSVRLEQEAPCYTAYKDYMATGYAAYTAYSRYGVYDVYSIFCTCYVYIIYSTYCIYRVNSRIYGVYCVYNIYCIYLL